LAENGDQDSLDHFWSAPRLPDRDLLRDFERIVRCRTLVNGNFYYGEGLKLAVQGCARRLLQ
ncbi:MAG: capsular biosynthesis protein, partial [Mailhella sp.]|nr:capsular biosynthesis protein [Mailhella sp.]